MLFRKKTHPHLHELIFDSMFNTTLVGMISMFLIVVSLFYFSYTSVRASVRSFIIANMLKEVDNTLTREAAFIEHRLNAINNKASLLQNEHEAFFEALPRLPDLDLEPEFIVHQNGALYKVNTYGSSVYYSSDTVIDDKAMRKAIQSERLDRTFKTIVESDALIQQVYLNTYDNMNRLYPYIENAPKQFGSTIQMTDYNFYFLADQGHNPSKQPVWTKAYLDPAGLGWMISCVVPIYNQGFLEGVTGIDITLSTVVSDLINIHLPVKSAMLLLDHDGDLVAMNPEAERILDLVELKEHTYTSTIDFTIYKPDAYNLKEQAPGSIGAFLYTHLDKPFHQTTFSTASVDYLLEKHTIGITNWQLVTITDEQNIVSEIRYVVDIINESLVIVSLFLILVMLVVVMLIMSRSRKMATKIAHPLQALEVAILNIGFNKQKVTLEDKGVIKEFGTLIEQYNKMVDQLDERTQQVVEKELDRQLQAKRAEKFKNESERDALTGLYNRRKLDDAINEEILRANRSGDPLSIILLDIDHFKHVNDLYGHSTGDHVLIDFANLLKTNTRETDIVGRWGGEEFLIIAPFTDEQGAYTLAESLRLKIQNHTFITTEKQTASFGVVAYNQDHDKRTFFNRVDLAMYKAKKNNRNNVVLLSNHMKEEPPHED